MARMKNVGLLKDLGMFMLLSAVGFVEKSNVL